MLKIEEIKRLTQHVISLPPAPMVLAKLLQIIDKPDVSLFEIERLISTDQALTAKLLKLTNSAYYGFTNKITTVQHAITLLGMDAVTNLALSLSVSTQFNNQDYYDAFDRTAFWGHSLKVALIAQMLCKDIYPKAVNEIFTIGILHDVGKLLIHEYFHDRYLEIEELQLTKKYPSLVAEKLRITIDHTQIGWWLCDSWNFPASIIMGIAFHHSPLEDTYEYNYSAIIHFADYLCNLTESSFPENITHSEKELQQGISDLINLKKKKIDNQSKMIIDTEYYMVRVKEVVEQAEDFLSLFRSVY